MESAEHDLELLESYLDGDLSPEKIAWLRHRLLAEPDLVATLDQLRAQRALRLAVWQQMETDEPVADRILSRLHASSQRRTRGRGWRIVQYVSAAAACIVIGFMVGWIGRGRAPSSAPDGMAGTTVNPNGMQFVHDPVFPQVGSPGAYQVVVTDENGRPVSVKRFNSIEDARRFVEEANRAQSSQQP